ncbi:MAG: PQQ-binding-like beta-propeller repeat protein [Patescibacteria group bacterium]|nr:PQQ-binding-like beta-propeller repeat protein [Patescibacteria group bacterium]
MGYKKLVFILFSFVSLFFFFFLGNTFLPKAHAQLATSVWPKLGHDAQHSGRSPYVGPSINHVKWHFGGSQGVLGAPAIGTDGTLYFGTEESNSAAEFYALNKDASVKWAYTIGSGDSFYGAPAIATDGTIYDTTVNGFLYAFNSDGTLKWIFNDIVNGISGSALDSPTIGPDGTIYYSAQNGYLFAVNPDGSTKWNYNLQNFTTYSSPALASDGTIYVGTQSNYSGGTPYNFFAVNSDGTLKWKINISNRATIQSSPVIGADGTIYLGSEGSSTYSWVDAGMYALNPSDGSIKWSFLTPNCSADSSAALGTDGTIYFACSGQTGSLYALNPDGTQKWSYFTGNGAGIASPTIGGDGTIYFSLQNSTFNALNPNGTLKWTYANLTSGTSVPPIDADGTLYVNSDGIYAFTDKIPVIGAISVSPNPVQINNAVTASSSFTDAVPNVTHTAVWDWGDGTTSIGTLSESNGSGTVGPDTHTYTASGVYTVTLTVTNSAGDNGSSTFEYVSVYNPTSQGLFSAGSKYTSPAGAYTQNTNLTGDVKFGLSYKYQGTMPVGDRQFSMNFAAANLTFNATTVSSLVIANGMGTLTGTGTINGGTQVYNFLVTGSETNNTIRVQITDPSNNNAVIYDTQPTDPATAAPTTSVSGKVLAH